MKKGTKLLAAGIAASMMLSGCGSVEQTTDTTTTEASGGTVNEQEEPAHITVEVFDRGEMTAEYGTPDNNQWTKWIQDTVKEKLNIDVEFVAIPRSEETTKISALIAAGQEPDIFFTYDSTFYNNWADDGALADLTPYIETAGTDLKSYLDNVLIYGQKDGKQYALNGKRVSQGTFCGFIRKDWLDQLGIEVKERNGVPSMTPSELQDALVKMKDAGLCKYPFGLALKDGKVQTAEMIVTAFVNSADFENEESKAVYYQDASRVSADGAKEGYRYINQCYNDGLINPDFALYGDDDLGEWVASGQCGFWTTTFWSYEWPDSYIPALYAANSDAEVMAIEICREDESANQFFGYAPNGAYAMVSSNCENVEAAVKYLNWLVTDEAHVGLLHGFEDEHWVYNEDGAMVAKDAEYNAKTRVRTGDLDLLLLNDPCGMTEAGQRVAAENSYDATCVELNLAAMKIADAHCVTPTYLVREPESKIEWKAELQENGTNVVIKSIMAAEDQFDQVFDENYEIYQQEGFGQVTEEVKEIYAETYKE